MHRFPEPLRQILATLVDDPRVRDELSRLIHDPVALAAWARKHGVASPPEVLQRLHDHGLDVDEHDLENVAGGWSSADEPSCGSGED